MVDRYRFSIPIEFSFDLPGNQNPNLREKLKEACIEAVNNSLRAYPGEHLYAYPIIIDDIKIEAECWLGFLGTKHAPNRFRSKEVTKWLGIATELLSRSKNEYIGYPHNKQTLTKKADVPFHVGRLCNVIIVWLSRYEYITFRHEELLRQWAEEYNCTKPVPKVVEVAPKKPKGKKKKAIPKRQQAWASLSKKAPYDDPGF